MIILNNRIAKITKKYNPFVWRLQFLDNDEIVNVFYALSEDWGTYDTSLSYQ